ncbi:MAG: DUF4091 domain-containing protein [Armatimonadetes bacterium]|nr:DUF4091 domain-containing protein [Armatimonadota bacterium]
MSRLAILVALLVLAGIGVPQVPAAVEVGGVTYDHVDPGEPFTAVAQPREDWQPARATRAEGRAGLIAYWRPAPEDLRPWSRPRPEECVRKPLRTFAALGETEPVWVAIYARDDLTRITARVEDLPEGVTSELFVVHFWPQRTSWRTRQYYITPELLLPYDAADGYAWFPGQGVLERKSYDLPAGTTGAVWLRLKVARSATPGTYRFRLHLQAEHHRRLTVPLELEVLPFELRKPEKRAWLMYADIGRWEKMSDQQRWIDAKDFAAHGMDGLVSMPLGVPDLSRLKEGVVKWDVSQTRRYLELLQQAGLRGPWVMSGGLVRKVQKALGLTVLDLKKPWPTELKEGLKTAARPLADLYSKLGLDWYFYGWDEPSGDNLYAIQQYQCWKEAGAPIYVTMCRAGFWGLMAQYLDAPCFSTSFVSNKVACEKTREDCRQFGKKFWWYGSGCYIGQEGRLFPNRYLAGILFWKTGADAQVSWTYMRPHENPFNDFDGVKVNRVEPKDQTTVYPWLEKAGDWSTYRGPIQTIQWEALREGIDDYCYLWTLHDLASRAAAAPNPERARAGRRLPGLCGTSVLLCPGPQTVAG